MTLSNIFSSKHIIGKIACLSLVIIIFAGCSTKKNTWARRNFHSMTTKYNIAFNGNESYKEGLNNIMAANKDDYSDLIPMFPISNNSNASSATSNMDRTIEKSRKAIKTHSIKKKPKKNPKKSRDAEYQAFYNQNEFNPALKEAWLLIGQAEFHKADFLGAVGTFTYITKYYQTDKNMVAKAQVWLSRAYTEMDWLYEAEQMLQKINQDDLKSTDLANFAAANATLLLRQQQYREAIPFVEMALSKEKNKKMKQRFTFLLAQLYETVDNQQEAVKKYSDVIKMNPPYEMDFNARIKKAQLEAGSNMDAVLKELRKMAKNSNNKDYLDQIYYTIGNTYLQNKDTVKAIENYNLAAESSTREGIEKAITLIKLGDLYYEQKNYVKAQPAYDGASKIITVEHKEYKRVSKLAEVLGELVVEHNTVTLQDSLQYLSTLSREEQLEIINKVISDLIEEEKKAEEKELAKLQDSQQSPRFVPTTPSALGGSAKWYFYNPSTVSTGKSDFQKRWGNRKLEDNWRRSNKSTSLFAENDFSFEENENDSILTEGGTIPQSGDIMDNKKPEFYLRQIPVTSEQIKLSDDQIASALYSMGTIYKDKLEDLPMAIETYEEFIRRFGGDTRVPEAYFQLFLTETRRGNNAQAEMYRSRILSGYPNTTFAQMLAQPDYVERFALMQKEQDSLYSATYEAYANNNFSAVMNNTAYARKTFPGSKLMPKFLFLEALTIGKTQSSANFEKALNTLVEAYPQSNVSFMAKDIAALIRQGREAQTGTSHGTLLTRRSEELKAELEEQGVTVNQVFSAEKQGKHRLMLISPASQQQIYELMYQVAAYNFTRFMIKDFDLVLNNLDNTHFVLSVTNFESYDETDWYNKSIDTDQTLRKLFSDLQVQRVIISDENFALIKLLGIDDYLLFQAQNLSGSAPTGQLATITQPVAVQPEKPKATETKPGVTPKPDTLPKPEVATPSGNTTPANEPATNVAEPKKEEAKEVKQEEKQPEPAKEVAAEKPVQQQAAQPETPKAEPTPTPVVETPKDEEEKLELYKGLFAYQPEKPHFVAVTILSGKINFDKFKADMDAYNAANYGMLNLSVSLEESGDQRVIIIGSFADANIAKSYLLRMVKERSLFEGLTGSNYRNLLGTQRNLNVMMQNNALNIYNTFMQEYYLK